MKAVVFQPSAVSFGPNAYSWQAQLGFFAIRERWQAKLAQHRLQTWQVFKPASSLKRTWSWHVAPRPFQ